MVNFNRIRALIKRNFLLTFRGIDTLTDFFYWPLFDILVWGFTGSWMARGTSNPDLAVIILSSLVLWQAVYRTNLDVSYNFFSEMWSRNVINLFVTPLTIQEWTCATMIMGGLNSFICALFGMTAVWLLYGIFIPAIGPWFLVLFVSLFFSGWTIGLFTASVLASYGGQAQKLIWVMGWLFVPFVGIFYPIEIMPLWAQTVAYCVPMTYFFKVLRIFIESNRIDFWLLFYGFILSFVYFIIGVVSFIYFFNRSKQRGLARLEDA